MKSLRELFRIGKGPSSSHTMGPDNAARIYAAVDRWIARGGHLHSSITIQTAADEMHLPRYLLSSWLKSTRQGLFNPWLTHLRIEEAKRQLVLHPEWNNDTIAEHCGFTSRTYFQTTFKRITGVTPQEFQTHQ